MGDADESSTGAAVGDEESTSTGDSVGEEVVSSTGEAVGDKVGPSTGGAVGTGVVGSTVGATGGSVGVAGGGVGGETGIDIDIDIEKAPVCKYLASKSSISSSSTTSWDEETRPLSFSMNCFDKANCCYCAVVVVDGWGRNEESLSWNQS